MMETRIWIPTSDSFWKKNTYFRLELYSIGLLNELKLENVIQIWVQQWEKNLDRGTYAKMTNAVDER